MIFCMLISWRTLPPPEILEIQILASQGTGVEYLPEDCPVHQRIDTIAYQVAALAARTVHEAWITLATRSRLH